MKFYHGAAAGKPAQFNCDASMFSTGPCRSPPTGSRSAQTQPLWMQSWTGTVACS